MNNLANGKRIFILLIIISLLSISGIIQAQQTNFLIQDYIPEKFKDIELRLNGDITFLGSENRNNTYDSNNRIANLSGYSRYRYITVPKYVIADLNIGGGYKHHNHVRSYLNLVDTDDSYYSESEYINAYNRLTFNPEIDAGYYFTDDMLLSTLSWFSYSHTDKPRDYDYNYYSERTYPAFGGNFLRHNIYKDEFKTNTTTKSYSFDINILSGIGHIYEGKFASTAMYIIEELRKRNLLDREPTEREMSLLSELLYQAKSEHFFDFRIHDEEAIKKISGYLVSGGIIDAEALRTTLAINDVWKYFPTYDRQFGFKFRAGVGLKCRHTTDEEKRRNTHFEFDTQYHPDTPDVIDTLENTTSVDGSEITEQSTQKYPYATAIFEYYRPVNHKWQLNFLGLLRYYLGANLVEEDSIHIFGTTDSSMVNDRRVELDDNFGFNISGEAIYIMNSRTSGVISGGFGYDQFNRSMTLNETDYEFAVFKDWNYFANLSLTYRISIPVTLMISAKYDSRLDVEAIMDIYEDRDYPNYSVGTSLTYNIL